MSKRSFWCRFM